MGKQVTHRFKVTATISFFLFFTRRLLFFSLRKRVLLFLAFLVGICAGRSPFITMNR